VFNELNPTNVLNYTVMHLRLGDVMSTENFWTEYCYFITGTCYTLPKDYYDKNILPLLSNKSPIMIVASPYHNANNITIGRSLNYLRNVVGYFREHGFEVTYMGDDKTPDEDFITMATAATFVAGGGGAYHRSRVK
jgi:hypothetical protein